MGQSESTRRRFLEQALKERKREVEVEEEEEKGNRRRAPPPSQKHPPPSIPTPTTTRLAAQLFSSQPGGGGGGVKGKGRTKKEEKLSGNVLSPISIFISLMVVALGANGDTRSQILNLLFGIEGNKKKKNKKAASSSSSPPLLMSRESMFEQLFLLMEETLACAESSTFLLSQKGSLTPDFKRILKELSIPVIPLGGSPNLAANQANALIKQSTHGLIQNMISPSDISGQTTHILLNCVYFKGEWETPFLEKNTRLREFVVYESPQEEEEPRRKKLKFMHSTAKHMYTSFIIQNSIGPNANGNMKKEKEKEDEAKEAQPEEEEKEGGSGMIRGEAAAANTPVNTDDDDIFKMIVLPYKTKDLYFVAMMIMPLALSEQQEAEEEEEKEVQRKKKKKVVEFVDEEEEGEEEDDANGKSESNLAASSSLSSSYKQQNILAQQLKSPKFLQETVQIVKEMIEDEKEKGDGEAEEEEELVMLALPKIKQKSKLNMEQVLAHLGVTDAFSLAKADFSHMVGDKFEKGKGGFCIDKIIHECLFEIDEKATVAAAATSTHMIKRCMRPPTPPPRPRLQKMILDRPFLYFVLHKDNILFSGYFDG